MPGTINTDKNERREPDGLPPCLLVRVCQKIICIGVRTPSLTLKVTRVYLP